MAVHFVTKLSIDTFTASSSARRVVKSIYTFIAPVPLPLRLTAIGTVACDVVAIIVIYTMSTRSVTVLAVVVCGTNVTKCSSPLVRTPVVTHSRQLITRSTVFTMTWTVYTRFV